MFDDWICFHSFVFLLLEFAVDRYWSKSQIDY